MKFIVIFTLIFIVSCSQEQEDSDFVTVTNKELGMEKQKVYIRDLVEMISKGLPNTLDSNTKWVQFTKGTEPKSVVYSFLLTSKEIKNFSKTEIENMGINQKEQLNNGYCTDPQYTFIRTHGISSEYKYFDKDFNYLFSVSSEDLNCEN